MVDVKEGLQSSDLQASWSGSARWDEGARAEGEIRTHRGLAKAKWRERHHV